MVLALALANEPTLLLADEPTTALDVTVQAEILDLLRRLRDRLGTSDPADHPQHGRGRRLADRVIVLRTGDLVEERGDRRAVLPRPRHPYTRTCSTRCSAPA